MIKFIKNSRLATSSKFFALIVCILSICFFAVYLLQDSTIKYHIFQIWRDFEIQSLFFVILTIILYLLAIPIISKIFNKNKIHIFLYVVFILLLSTITFIAIQTLFGPRYSGGNIDWSYIINKIYLLLPLVWLTSHVNGIINKRAKLSVEYEHKQKVLEFYVAFKTQVYDDEELGKILARGVADVILRYPSVIGEAQETDSPFDKIFRRSGKVKVKESIDGNLTRKAFDKIIDE